MVGRGVFFPPPHTGKIISYTTLEKNRGKLREKEKNQGKRRKFRGETEKIRKNNEKEIKILKNCHIKLENFIIFLQKELFYW